MNSLIKRTALSGLLIGALPIVHAAPSIALGDDASLFVTGKAGLESHSNIYRSSTNERADTVLVITPGLELTMGGEGSSNAKLSLGYEVRRNFEEDMLNGEYVRASFGSLYDSGVVVLRSYAGYNEFGTNAQLVDGTSPDNAGVAERSDITAGVSSKYKLTEQMAIGAGVDYLQRDWNDNFDGGRPTFLTGTESLAVPVKLFFAVAPELDAFVGYRHRTVKAFDVNPMQVGQVPDYTDSYYFAGIEGELFNPLWTVNIDVGFQDREYELSGSAIDGNSSDGLTFTARVNYEADVNRTYYAVLAKDYGQSTTRAISYERTRFTIGGDYRITEMWSAVYNVTLAESEYDADPLAPAEKAREEHLLMGQIGINYEPNEYLSVGASYQYVDRNLDNAFLYKGVAGLEVPNPGYSNHIWQISASVRY